MKHVPYSDYMALNLFDPGDLALRTCAPLPMSLSIRGGEFDKLTH